MGMTLSSSAFLEAGRKLSVREAGGGDPEEMTVAAPFLVRAILRRDVWRVKQGEGQRREGRMDSRSIKVKI